ncbi:hypothetical protein [Parasediminibacterium sp. JCM 36343]|uniref:hypothetical protein n=1 Tax=Parasediminibacterium sp. JCM 36343 TaxID=3374279 RepID=UPI00397CF118
MKKQNLNKIAKRFFVGNLVAAALFLSMQASAANVNLGTISDNEIHADSLKANKLDVKYLGNSSNGLEFDVRYNNAKGNTFSFVIKDENGEVLFEKKYTNKAFYKKVQLPRIDEVNKLSFSIVTDNDYTLQTKDIVIKTKYIEDVLVKIN